MDFRFFVPVEIQFGKGKIELLKDIVKTDSCLIVSDPVLKKIGIVDKIKAQLSSDCTVNDFCEVEPNPSCETVDRGVELAREVKADYIIALGGGSAIDAAKAICCLSAAKGDFKDYLYGEKQFVSRETKLIAIPTTSGTGSEVTNVGVYTDKEKGIKKPFVTDLFWCDRAIVDPEMTISLPKRPTASTSLDAFTHAIEAYWADSTQPISKLLSLEAMKLIVENLELAINNPYNYEARENLLYASLIAGISFAQTRTTVLHALSFPLTSQYGLEHGFACAIALPEVMKDNYEFYRDEMDKLLKYLDFEDMEGFSAYFTDMMKNIDAPVRLREIGIKEENLDEITEITLNAPISRLNPKKYNKEELKALLNKIL
jgi:alcohol dehydrogenase